METGCEVTIILLGESDVGKTSLLLRFVENKFRDSQPRTLVNKYEKVIRIEGNLVKLTLWDTAGRKEYKKLVKNYYNVADGVLLIYDIQNSNTFFELSKWLTDFKSVNKNAEILIAGNKSEDESKNSVNLADVENFVRTENIDCMKVSAKLNKNVNILFYHIVQKVLVAKEILKYSKYSQLTELEKSKSFISSNSISPEPLRTVNKSSTINESSTTKPFVSCVESIEQNTSGTINTSTTTKSLSNCVKSVEQNVSRSTKTSRAIVPLNRGVKSIKKNVSSASSTTKSPLNCVTFVEQNTNSAINTPSMTATMTNCVKSTEQHSNTLESASNGKIIANEVYKVEDDEDRPWKVYDNSSYSMGQSIFYYPQDKISDQDSRSVESAETAEEFSEATGDNCSRDSSLNDYGFIFFSEDELRTVPSGHSQLVDSAENGEKFFGKRRKKASLFHPSRT